jgi:hypothetical protein
MGVPPPMQLERWTTSRRLLVVCSVVLALGVEAGLTVAQVDG